MLDITLQQIASFIKVAEFLNFTRAAESLFITQPALSRIISRFERSANTTLFIRKSHGVELSEKGQQLYDELSPIFYQMKTAILAAGDNGEGRKSIRIACHTSFDIKEPRNTFRTAIEAYSSRNTDDLIDIALFELRDLKDSLLASSFDFIYSVSLTFENLGALAYKKIEDVMMTVIMSNEHPLAAEKTLSPDDLTDISFYFVASRDSDSYLALCGQFGFSPKKVILLPNYPSVIMAIRQGKGMTLAGIDVKYTYGSDLRYIVIPCINESPCMVLAWRPDSITTEMRELIDMIP